MRTKALFKKIAIINFLSIIFKILIKIIMFISFKIIIFIFLSVIIVIIIMIIVAMHRSQFIYTLLVIIIKH